MKIKKLFTNIRVIILMVFLVLAVVAINPNFSPDGVTIRNIVQNSSASDGGLESPAATAPPMSRERVLSINNDIIDSVADYYDAVAKLQPNQPITVKTNENTYRLTTRALVEKIVTNETELVNVTETVMVNESVNGTYMMVEKDVVTQVEQPIVETKFVGTEDLGLKVYEAPTTNIRKGLDLQGGTRVLLRPEEKLNDEMMEILIANMQQRLNIYGLSDIVIRQAGDLFSDTQYIIVEIAGANEDEVKNLISQQGKFEAKVGDDTVFMGGAGDITHVCRSADCSGIDPYRGCGALPDGTYSCRFRFSIALKPEAAEKQSVATGKLETVKVDDNGNLLNADDQYLNESLELFLDDKMVDSLRIGSDLKGRAVTDISISGSGVGATEQEAAFNALENMKQLQTIMITGSLPTKLIIEKSDNLSPQFGNEFIKNALLIGALSILAVSLVVYIRYRRAEIFFPMVTAMVSEVVLLLGLASLIGWNLDLAAIAGIIIAVGTGVDDQIVITDETLRGGRRDKYINWATKLKNAFYIIMAAYFTTLVAMVPLLFAGAGMLKGFAITTIAGISFGVFITRPAFGAMMEILLKEE